MVSFVDREIKKIYCAPMKEIKKTQRQAAQALGVSHVYLNSVLCGRRRPSAVLARKIEEELSIPKETLRPDVFATAQPQEAQP